MPDDLFAEALEYHMHPGRPGKTQVVPTKPCATQRELSLAYSPGVAQPCLEIAQRPEDAYRYTNKGNLVAVISNGTAVLGLGDIGPLASKPVMEGKAVLFKRFADIDVFDIEIAEKDPGRFIDTVAAIAPTFGGINLEDISGKHCFRIERELTARLDIPVFHDDQHGTAIIAAAALLNACELTQRRLDELRCVVNGAGAAGLSVARLLQQLGLKRENMLLCDSRGVLHTGRSDLDVHKAHFAAKTEARSLADAMAGADCFIGCSVGRVVSPEMLLSMAANPIVFAMANPTPEIDYPLAKATRDDVIMATGRSDYPNQVNNVLGFPFIFRGALDVGATSVNDAMKFAAVHALAALAKEPVPESVSFAYGGGQFAFGRDYLIPKPFDPRVLYWEAVAVAKAAIESGVARRSIDLDAYRESLRQKVETGRSLIRVPMAHAKNMAARLVMPEGELPKVIRAARSMLNEGLGRPMLVGDRNAICAAMAGVDPAAFDVIDPAEEKHLDVLISQMQARRRLENLTADACRTRLRNPYVHAAILTECGLADGLLAVADRPYIELVRPILTYATRRPGVSRAAGMHLLALPNRQLFFADTTLIPDPSAEELAEIALRVSRTVARFNITPRVAFVSFENFSRRDDRDIAKLRRAHRLVRELQPDLESFADVQADVAVHPDAFRTVYGDRLLALPANVLVFPNLHSANAAFRLARVVGEGRAIGPILLGLNRPYNVMPSGSTEEEIIEMIAITAYNAGRRRVALAKDPPPQSP